jgi:succinate dehydrogenase / fumarate reductase, cytochrome b subunit
MAIAVTKENYVLHRIHSLTGIVPVGYYMAQHLTLNTFSIGGRAKFNGVIEFFEGMPKFFLLGMEVFAIWLPLLFHAVYGLFIVSRAENNYLSTKYKWSQNRMYFLQRVSGLFIFAYLIFHVSTTTGVKYFSANGADAIKFDAWHDKLQNPIILLTYILGIAVSSYHLGYGLWNFSIRWGIAISEAAQMRVQKISTIACIALTLLGWGALFGFLKGDSSPKTTASVSVPITTTNTSN